MSLSDKPPLYILIDDDRTHNTITRLMIANTINGCEIIDFSEPAHCLNFLTNDFEFCKQESAVLLLNLNMPSMSGWDFLDRFGALEGRIRDRTRLYILTSSIDQEDRLRSERIENVKGFLSKPLSGTIILTL